MRVAHWTSDRATVTDGGVWTSMERRRLGGEQRGQAQFGLCRDGGARRRS